jgi:tetratricopeptide (TPR) repeat protein
MNHLLKAMGFWVWSLIAIGLSASMVSVSFKVLSIYREHSISIARPDSSNRSMPVAAAPATASETPVAPSGTPTVSKAIAREMRSAQQALQSARWNDALDQLVAAKSKSPLTAFDQKAIYDWMGFVYVKTKNFQAAQSAYAAALATGQYHAEELIKIFRVLFQLAAANHQNAEAIAFGERIVKAGAANDKDLLLMTQLHYAQKDCESAGIWSDQAIAASKQAGEAPKEVLFQIKLQCASDHGDASGMKAALYDLVRLTNKTSYWNNLIRLERQDERDDHNTLMIYRVMFDTHSMNADTDYIEMAQLLGDAALPGEARVVLEQAMSSGLMKDEHKERATRLLDALRTRADADMNGLQMLEAAATQNPAGQLDMKLGEVYFGAGDYQDAVTALSRGIGKGLLLQPDEAYISLGRSLTADNDSARAKKAFAKFNSLPNLSARVRKLWNLYADMLPETVSAPL